MSEHCLRPRDLPVRTGRAKFKYPESDEMNLHAVADVREQVRVMENIQQALKAQTAVLNDRGASAQSHASARKGMEVCVDALDGLTGSFKKTVPRMNGADASAYVDARLQSERKRKHRMQGGRDLTPMEEVELFHQSMQDAQMLDASENAETPKRAKNQEPINSTKNPLHSCAV